MKKFIIPILLFSCHVSFSQWNEDLPNNKITTFNHVGIGITNPSEKLEVYNSTTSPGVISLRSHRNDAGHVDVGRLSAKQAHYEVARIGMPRAGETYTGYLTFWTKSNNSSNLSEKVRITETGDVGIGIANPSEKLEVYNSTTSPGVISLRSHRNDAGQVDVGRLSAKQAHYEVARIGMPRAGETYTGYLTFWTKSSNSSNLSEKVRITETGDVGIGTIDTKGFKLGVNGKIAATEVKVAGYSEWSDFVFEEDYMLPSLQEVENHIRRKGHLKDIPSAEEINTEGFFLGEMDAKLLQKIEELTLYLIEQNKKLKKANNEILKLKEKVSKLEKL